MKAEKIKQKIQQTKEKRKNQIPTIIQCKLQNLSKRKIQILERLFLEAKWLYNWLIADISRVNLSTKDIKYIDIKVKENFEKRELTIIGSQIKQGLQDRVKQALKGLKNSKVNGNKVGSLKFKSRINSIPLKQYGITYKIDKQHRTDGKLSPEKGKLLTFSEERKSPKKSSFAKPFIYNLYKW